MEEFLKQYFGTLDTPVIIAIGLISATGLTAFYRFLGNLKSWGPWPNPLFGYNTDSLMPYVCAAHGAAYGWIVGPLPGLADNARNSILYAGGAVLCYYIVGKVLATWGIGAASGKPS